MKNIVKYVLGFVFAAVLAACGGGGGGGGHGHGGGNDPGSVRIQCAGVYNDGQPRACVVNLTRRSGSWLSPMATAYAAAPIDLGEISRSVEIFSTMDVTNSTETDFLGFWSAVTDLDCAGRTEPWEMASGGIGVQAGHTETLSASRQCGDASLGRRFSMTMTLFAEDQVTVLDQAVITFTLVE